MTGQRTKKRISSLNTIAPDLLIIGHILAPWGIKGELKVDVMTDFPQRFAPQQEVYVAGCPMTIEKSRKHGKNIVLKLATIDRIEDAEKLRGQYLTIPGTSAYPLPEGQYYRFQMIGLEVQTVEGESLGVIADILPTGSNDVYIVDSQRGKLLVPAIEDVVKSVDLEKGRIVIEVIEGLFP